MVSDIKSVFQPFGSTPISLLPLSLYTSLLRLAIGQEETAEITSWRRKKDTFLTFLVCSSFLRYLGIGENRLFLSYFITAFL
jgi:hypothetical protein